MKNQCKFLVSSLAAVALVAAMIFGGAALVTAQTNSAAPGAQTRPAGQATIPSTPQVSTFRTLVNFNGTNGAEPAGNQLTQGIDGNFYGATFGGGQYGNGLLFKVTPAGTLTPLYNFCSQPGCADGSGPSPLLLATSADFYGGTYSEGAFGYGTIFEFAGEGNPITLQSFDAADGRRQLFDPSKER